MLQASKNSNTIQTTILNGTGFSMQVVESIAGVAEEWDNILEGNNTLLSSAYLMALELYPPFGMAFRYLVLRDLQGCGVGVAYFQIQHFNAANSLNEADDKKSPWLIGSLQKYVKDIVARNVVFNTFVFGNLLLTGENAFYFRKNIMPDDQIINLMTAAAESLQLTLNSAGIQCNVCLMKDFKAIEPNQTRNLLSKKNFHEFCVQPCMMMSIQDEWLSFDDYLGSLHSKYRVRAKRAFKKRQELSCRELGQDEILLYQNQIHDLYMNVAQNAGFNTVNLHVGYFYGLKKYLGDKFQLFAYFRGNVIKAFYTIIHNGHELEAHFLGYDKKENAISQIYLNSLFDIIQHAIEGRFSQINFSRTALEIKSSVGAVPLDMYCYMKHRSHIPNKFIKPIIDYLNPDFDWQPRRPFK